MELIAAEREQQIWFLALSRPYTLGEGFFGAPFVCILFVNDKDVTAEEQANLSEQMVHHGCRYCVCAGDRCSSWDDSVDAAATGLGDFDANDERFVMTTWHEQESVEDVIFHGLKSTVLGEHEFSRFLILFVGPHTGLLDEIRLAIETVCHSRDGV